MAKVKITGHASGTGVITVTAPNTSTDRTITLPDATATIATTTDVAARLPSITDGGNATAMTITSAENIGIGTASPQSLLHIKGNGIGFHIESATNSTSRTWGLNTETVAGGDLTFQYGTSTGANPSVTSLRLVNDGRGLSQFTAKAWANFNGTGTPAFRDSHNFSSITDSGTGVYRVNFTVAMANTNYGAFVSAQGGNESQPDNWNTSYIQVDNRSVSNSGQDAAYLAVLVFGD
jgi:hypothetical protein